MDGAEDSDESSEEPVDIVRVHSVAPSVPKSYKVHLKIRFYRSRPILLALKTKIEADLEGMEKLGITEKIETSEWASLTVSVMKADGSV